MEVTLIIKERWLSEIERECDPKKQEYRDLTPYYFARFLACWDGCRNPDCKPKTCPQMKFKPVDSVQFAAGYQRSSRRATFVVKKIFIGEGFTKWGAAPGVEYFVLVLGNRIKESNEN